EVDGVELWSSAGTAAFAEDHEHAAVGGPGRALVVKSFGEDSLTRAVRAHDADQEAAGHLLGEGDEIAARRPNRRGIAALAGADAPLAGAVARHHIELLGPVPIRFEGDRPAVRTVARPRVDGARLRQAAHLPAAQ